MSLTDHDTLEGPRALRATRRNDVPLSMEWTLRLGSAPLCWLHELMRIDRREILEADCCADALSDPVPLLGAPPPAATV